MKSNLFAKQKQICDYIVTDNGWYRKTPKVALACVTRNTHTKKQKSKVNFFNQFNSRLAARGPNSK